MAVPDIQKLGILAGKGALPTQIVKHCKLHGTPYFVLAFEETLDSDMNALTPDAVVPLGAIGTGLAALKEAGVKELVMAGHIKRPSLRKINMDAQAKKLLKKLGMNILGGDDALLRALISFLEEEGFSMLAAHEILGGLTIGVGAITTVKPNDDHAASIQKGMDILKHIGSLDIGQSLVIEDSIVLGVEAAEGTDGLINRSKEYMKSHGQAVLVKAKKSDQDERVDMPTIGPDTIRTLAAAGFAGLAIEANNVLVIERDQVEALANQHQLFVVAA